MSLTKIQLADKLTAILAGEVKAFLAEQSPEATRHEADIEAARQQAAAATHPIIANAIKQAIKELEAAKPDDSAAKRQEAALAILAVTNALHLPLALKGGAEEATPAKASKAKKEGTGSRMTRIQIKELAEKLLKAIPAGGEVGIADLAGKAGVSVGDTRSALLRLKREGKVVPSGVKGRGAGWKLA